MVELEVPFFSTEFANKDIDLNFPINRVLESQCYVLGEEVSRFEHEFAQFCGVSDCISVANGTDALEISLRALGVRYGDEVVLVANAGFYGSTAVHLTGGKPVYVEIDKDSLCMSVKSLQNTLTNRQPKAIIITHLYGQLAHIEALVKLAEQYKIPVIEDCAQSHGALRNGKRAGSFGSIGCFSFYPTKNLGALGDGGAIVANESNIAEKLRQLRQYGWSVKYKVDTIGGRNSRLDELQAAILRIKLKNLDYDNSLRREIATQYSRALVKLPVKIPISTAEDYVAHLYVVQIQDRNSFCTFLNKNGVATNIHYPIPDHLQNGYKCNQNKGSLPSTEEVCMKVVSLPCYPNMPDKHVSKVIDLVKKYFIHIDKKCYL